MAEYMRKYRATPEGYKRSTFAQWKFNGLKGDYEIIYEKYITFLNCEKCNVLFGDKGKNKKCMDHNHITGEFRYVLCQSCNAKTQSNCAPGRSVGITFVKKKKLWKYRKQTDGITHQKMMKNKQLLLWYKFLYLIRHKFFF